MATHKQAHDLKKKIQYFLTNTSREKGIVSQFITELSCCGEVAIIGGLIRDLALNPIHLHQSDIDLVVDCDHGTLETFLENYSFKRNKFGGLRIEVGSWDLDVWTLQNTWAFTEGHVNSQNFEGLLETTFFNWDAILYLVRKDQLLYDENYFEQLNNKVLDFNLLSNPNPLGTLHRTAKFFYSIDDSVLTRRLEQYFIATVEKYKSEALKSNSIKCLLQFLVNYNKDNSLFSSSIEKHQQRML